MHQEVWGETQGTSLIHSLVQVFIKHRVRRADWKGHQGIFWGDDNVLDLWFTRVCICQNSSSCMLTKMHFAMCKSTSKVFVHTILCMYLYYYNIAVNIIILISIRSIFQSQLHARHCPRCLRYVNRCLLHNSIKYYYYPHFRDKETKAQRREITCLRHTASKLQSWDSNRHPLAPESVLLATNQLFLILHKTERSLSSQHVCSWGRDTIKLLTTQQKRKGGAGSSPQPRWGRALVTKCAPALLSSPQGPMTVK